jgi:hypothetical protein
MGCLLHKKSENCCILLFNAKTFGMERFEPQPTQTERSELSTAPHPNFSYYKIRKRINHLSAKN